MDRESRMQSAKKRRMEQCTMQGYNNDGTNAAAAPDPGKQHSSGGRCLKPGPVMRNPYLNFLREFRTKNCGLSAIETVRQGAVEWQKLSSDQKLKYVVEAFYAPRLRRRRRRRLQPRANSAVGSVRRSRRRGRSTARKSGRTMRGAPGPMGGAKSSSNRRRSQC